MSSLAYHAGHCKAGAVGGLGRHNWQKRGERDSHSNQDIDPSRSNLNLLLQVPDQGSLYRAAKERIEAGCTGRVTAHSNWISETIVYPPDDVIERYRETQDPTELRRYYEDVLEWHRREFGEDNVLAAVVHLDETTPHMHTDIVPLTADGRLSTKDVFARRNLNRHHTELAAYLSERGWDIQRGESTKDKQVRSVSVPEYKRQAEAAKVAAIAQVAELGDELTSLRRQISIAQKNAQERAQEAQEASERLQGIQDDLARLEAPERVRNVQAKPAWGGKVKLPDEDYELIKSWADQGVAAVEQANRLQAANDYLRQEMERLSKSAKENFDLEIENANLRRKLKRLEEQQAQVARRRQAIVSKAAPIWDKYVKPAAKAQGAKVMSWSEAMRYWEKHDRAKYIDQAVAAMEIAQLEAYEASLGGPDYFMAEMLRLEGKSEQVIRSEIRQRWPQSQYLKDKDLSLHR